MMEQEDDEELSPADQYNNHGDTELVSPRTKGECDKHARILGECWNAEMTENSMSDRRQRTRCMSGLRWPPMHSYPSGTERSMGR